MNKETKNKVVPELRFPEFKDAEGWKVEPLGKVYSFKSTNSFTRDDLNYESGSIKNIHYGDIHTKFSTLFDVRKEVVPFINPSISIDKIDHECYCIEGDIVFADASEDLQDVGKSIEIVYLNGERLLSGMHTLLARQKEPKLIVGFGGHLFTSDSIRTQIQRESQGAKVLGISASRLSNIKIFYPEDQKEQQKIAYCLSSLDELITAENQKLEALKAHKKGLMQQLFPAEGKKVPELRFAEFKESGEWEEKALGKLGEFTGGGTPSKSNLNYWEGNIPWVSSSDIDEDSIHQIAISRFITDEALKDSATKMVPAKSILIVSRVGVGKLAISNDSICTSQDFTSFTPENDNIYFFAYLLKSQKEKLHGFSQGMAIKGFTKDDISNLEVLIPSQIEQQKIAECLFSLDDLIKAQAEKLEALKEHKKGLMQGLFLESVYSE
jgi:type I restriction enzyme S subunit